MIKEAKSRVFVRKLYRTRWFWILRNFIRGIFQQSPIVHPIVDDRQQLDMDEMKAEKIIIDWGDQCLKPRVGLVRDRREYPYWTKFERFLKNNQIPFEYYTVHNSNWVAAAEKFDVILWATEEATSYNVEESRRKVYILEQLLGKTCFPSFDTLMWNEDKITQYELLKIYKLPIIDTFISHDLNEIRNLTSEFSYPLVTKLSTGAGSVAVELIKNGKQARTIIKDIFSVDGRKTYWPYFRQKDYVYFQKFQPNEGYDLRIIVIGNNVLGYYRDVPGGEYRASGMNTVRFGAIPEAAARLAREVARAFNEVVVAVDMLKSPLDGKFYIIELGAMPTIDLPGDLIVNGVKGVYFFDAFDRFIFKPGIYWTQEFMLREFFQRKWISNSAGK